MKAIRKIERKHGGIRVDNIEPPTPKEDEVLVEIKNASICGSDIHAYHFPPTHHFIQPPVTMGHECSGQVVEVGKNVTDYIPGDRVVIEPIVNCGKCESCLKGNYYICNNFNIRGMHRDGIFTERVAVNPKSLHKIPDTLSFEKACLVEPTSVLTHAILDRSDIKAGDLVLVTGPGPIGLLAAQMVKVVGAEPIVVGVDSDEDVRLPLAREFGFQTINTSVQTIPEALNEKHGRETVHAVVECSGAPPIFQTTLEVVVKGGSITLVGLFANPVEANLSNAVRKELSIYTSFSQDWVNFERAIKLLDEGVIQTEKMVAYYQPEDAVDAFEDAIAKKVPKPVFSF
ncbi:L-iditol 2-dehydrogenase [Geomicrobium halophilum]|uniref:L-iditol 2-dehydrogenase n=1 Tax=Geomicrobium halophilum TaxID=549000 RepID=A0A841PN40_9BACL|nr:alcohol dehydrogenase catalytic domain-containing protein [Geomicrobium halophilum]MBB6448626.1 L-iditol 2-dehydrogenase [Geomicrobium halophilum]